MRGRNLFRNVSSNLRCIGITLGKFLVGVILGMVFAHQVFFISPRETCTPKAADRQLLFVGVMTANKFLDTRAKAIFHTWGSSVPGKIVFFTSSQEPYNFSVGLPIVQLKGVEDSNSQQKKSLIMLKYMKKHYAKKFEWFLLTDDDVFINTEKLENLLRSRYSNKPMFIGQAEKGNAEEFGRLSLEYEENYCMGGPGMIMSHVTLSRVAPNVERCFKNLQAMHQDVEVERCLQTLAGIPCIWPYQMQRILYHHSSGLAAFTGQLKWKEVHRAITMPPFKDHQYMYWLHNYLKGMSIRKKAHEILKIKREMASLDEEV